MISDAERARRLEQSRKDNPQKWAKSRLKRGCCANCTKNIEDPRDQTGLPGFRAEKRRKCAASNNQIFNEYGRCEMYERASKESTREQNKSVRNAIFGIR